MITLQESVHAAPKPDDWQMDKLHQVFRVRRGHKNAGMKEDNLLSLSYGRIIQKDIDTADGLLPENFEGYQIVEPGNIVLRLTDLQNDKRSLRQGLVKQRGIITSAYDAVEVQRDNDPRFWFYSLLALDLAKHYYSLGGGVRQSVKFSDFPNDWVYRPDLATQRQIADFLDRETARIDQLIEKKQRLVALLGEKLQAEISTLVKKGASDQSIRLRHVARLNPSARGLRLEPDASVTFCPMEAIHDGVGGIDTSNTRPISEVASASYNFFAEGDILLAKVTPCFENGKKALARDLMNGVGFATSEVFVVRVDPRKTSPEYLVYLFSSDDFQYAGRSRMTGAGGLRRISERSILDFPLLVTDRLQQQEIVGEIDKEVGISRKINTKTNASIDRLKEYRTALVTAAVTGQIDVTTFAKSGTPDRQLDAIQEEMGA